MKISAVKSLFAILLLAAGAGLAGQGTYIHFKASLADWLISNSWAHRQTGHLPAKPWPWADTRVVARLRVARLGVRHFIMRDASGESLAFGPGSMLSERLPGTRGHSLVAGHRDTHFSFLADLQPGDLVEIDNYLGQIGRYEVRTARVINVEQQAWHIDPGSEALTLVTCWPLDALVPGGPERLLVEAERIGD